MVEPYSGDRLPIVARFSSGLLAPAEELVALPVPLELQRRVPHDGVGHAEYVDGDRVVDDEVDGDAGLEARRVAAPLRHGVAHGGQVDEGGDAGEVLHQDAGRPEGDLGAVARPAGGEALDVGGGHGHTVLGAEEVLEEDLQ